MGDQRPSGRRTSARLRDKEDAPVVNGVGHALERAQISQNSLTAKNGNSAANGLGNGIAGGRSKRKLEYDEEDDGFIFTRAKSKRVKATQAVQVPESVHEERHESTKPLPAKKSRKKSLESNKPVPASKEEAAPRRRSTRNSGDRTIVEPLELVVPKRRQKENAAARQKKVREPDKSQTEEDVEDGMDLVGHNSKTPARAAPSRDTKIALPFADTPIIRRNKEMRKGSDSSRRSSLGMRGRRASSLIDSGTSNALPHDEVESSEFYKHIESGLPEPRRMRQLLTWCGTRAIGEKPSFATNDGPAKLAAWEIQKQLLKDFSIKSDLSDWFGREDTDQPQTLKPNPKNMANSNKILELEQQLERLRTERQAWESLLRPPASTPFFPPLPTSLPPLQNLPITNLSPTESTALSSLSSLQPSSALENSFAVRSRLESISQNIEFEVDKLVDSVHGLGQHVDAAEKVGSNVLRECARILEERDRRAREKEGGVGMRDVLRGLSRVVDR